ncbi:MAG: tetratricopeptide repeat protein [Polyangiaceae bacterium]|nr:tetratricopeptide repeat protein [Polyangiaceae bacterium]
MKAPVLSAFALVLVSSVASAQPKDDGVRRDPKGLKGISPFWEHVKKGDSAYIARDFEGAIAAYRQAIAEEPQNAMGHYRIGEAHLKKGDLPEAEAAWVAGLRFVGGDAALKAKLLFVLADLRERQKAHDDAVDRWTAYATHVQEKPESKGYPATAEERKKRVADWKKMLEEAKVVKERIAKRVEEASKK